MRRLITTFARETPYLFVTTVVLFFLYLGVATLLLLPRGEALPLAAAAALLSMVLAAGRALWAARRRRRRYVTITDTHSSRIAYNRRE